MATQYHMAKHLSNMTYINELEKPTYIHCVLAS